MANNSALVELHVDNFEPIIRYYLAIGFSVAWERKPEAKKGYLVLKYRDNVLCFWGGNQAIYDQSYFKRFPKDTVRGYGVELIIMVDNIEDYYEKFKDVMNIVEPLKEQPWGLKDFRATDPAGYYLRFTSDHNILDNVNAVD